MGGLIDHCSGRRRRRHLPHLRRRVRPSPPRAALFINIKAREHAPKTCNYPKCRFVLEFGSGRQSVRWRVQLRMGGRATPAGNGMDATPHHILITLWPDGRTEEHMQPRPAGTSTMCVCPLMRIKTVFILRRRCNR